MVMLKKPKVLNRQNVRRLDRALSALSPSEYDEKPDTALMAAALITEIGGNTLGWLARNNPMALERLMDQTDPGHRYFWAITMVYEAYGTRIKRRADSFYRNRQEETLAGLERNGKRRGMRAAKPRSRRAA